MSCEVNADPRPPHDKRITAYVVGPTEGWTLEPASPRRAWMDDTGGFAYRCLPLVMANQAGWVARCPAGFEAVWNGGTNLKDTTITMSSGSEKWDQQVSSHFGWGIVTISIPWLFRTSPGWALHVRGPTNAYKANCAPLEGLVETDWLPATFTMNWKIIEPDRVVRFAPNEAVCHVAPYPIEALETFEARTAALDDDEQFAAQYRAWSESRTAFNARPDRTADEWQKDYLHGRTVTGERAHAHRTKLSLDRFYKP